MERAFLKQGLKDNKKAFAGFYLTLKSHKLKPGQNVTHLKSRPIVSCPGSLLHPLGVWTDRKLQALAKEQVIIFPEQLRSSPRTLLEAIPPDSTTLHRRCHLHVYEHTIKHRNYTNCKTYTYFNTRSTTKTKRSTNCCFKISNAQQHLLLRRYDIQTDERDCHGDTASTPLRNDLLQSTRI